MSNNHELNKNNLPLSRKNVVFLKLMCYNIKHIDRCTILPFNHDNIKELFNMKGFGAAFLALVSAAAGAVAAVYAMKKHEELEQYDYDYDDDDEMYFGDDCDDDCDDCSCSSCTSETPEELDKLDSDEPAAAPAPEAEDEADSSEDF